MRLSVALAGAAALLATAPWLVGAGVLVGATRRYFDVQYPGGVLVGWIVAGAGFLAALRLRGLSFPQ